MPRYQVAYHKNTKHAQVQPYGDALPANEGGQAYVNIGDFYHDASQDNLGDNLTETRFGENHALFHHVRDILYKRSAANPAVTAMFPNNITDIDRVMITWDMVKNNVSISTTPATQTLTVAAPTIQLVTAFTPSDSTNQNLTYVSSDPTKATVSATGLVTRVANGTTTITITTVEGSKTDTVAITCTA